MPNPLAPFKNCRQVPLRDRLERLERESFEAQQAFQGFTYRMPRERDLTTDEWREFNRLRNDYLVKSASRDRAFLALQMCETRYTVPPRPKLVRPKGQ